MNEVGFASCGFVVANVLTKHLSKHPGVCYAFWEPKLFCNPEAQPQLAELYRCLGSLYSPGTLECSLGCGRTGSMAEAVGFGWATGGIWA